MCERHVACTCVLHTKNLLHQAYTPSHSGSKSRKRAWAFTRHFTLHATVYVGNLGGSRYREGRGGTCAPFPFGINFSASYSSCLVSCCSTVCMSMSSSACCMRCKCFGCYSFTTLTEKFMSSSTCVIPLVLIPGFLPRRHIVALCPPPHSSLTTTFQI